MTDRLFRKRLSERDLHALADSCHELPAHVEDRGFTRDVLAFLVKAFVDLRERENLVKLISMRCPNWGDYPEHVEYYLAVRGKALGAPILILCEAYSKSQVPETRRTLAAAVRRAFEPFKIGGKGDAEYVENAVRWYKEEKSRLAANPEYTLNEISPGSRRQPLFIEKLPSEERPGESRRPSDGEAPAPAPAGSRQSVEEDSLKLAGTWAVVSKVAEGLPVPEERINGVRFVFRNDLLTLVLIGPDGERIEQRGRVRLGRQSNLRTIDLVTRVQGLEADGVMINALIDELANETSMGIYELNGDLLRVCIGLPGGWRRPTSFESRVGSGTTVMTLKRARQRSRWEWKGGSAKSGKGE
jgi:uncharacterized protein (TIGR03067 family)